MGMSGRLPQEDGRCGRTAQSGTELSTKLGFLLLALLPIFFCRCSSVAVRKEGGASSRFWPTAARWQEASMNALRDPTTWGPAAGAAVVAAGGWDPKISHWATTRTPVFGSINRAKSASDDLRSLSDLAMLGTSMAVPGGDHPWRSRLERLIVEETGVFMASSVTNLMKRSLSRERPDLSDNRSFPSGHSTRAFAYNGMSSR